MQYTDQNEYHRRIDILREVMDRHPDLVRTLSDANRGVLQDYFLSAAQADDPDSYRVEILKKHPNLERQANKAYERFLAEAGLPETLPQRQ
jgi:hypothetical protein